MAHAKSHTNVTYPPLDVPKPVSKDVWVVDGAPISAYGMPMPVRMTVIRLADGDLLLHSPTHYSARLQAQLTKLGRIRHLVAPNIAHWTFTEAWQKACPDTVTWAAPGLSRRAPVKRLGLRIDRELGEKAPPDWDGEIEHTLVEGALGFREVAMFHRRSKTLVLTDLVVNLEPSKLPAWMALLMRVGRSAAPLGSAPPYLRFLIRLKKRSSRPAALNLIACAPERVIFAHGQWFENAGAEQLERSLAWLVAERRA